MSERQESKRVALLGVGLLLVLVALMVFSMASRERQLPTVTAQATVTMQPPVTVTLEPTSTLTDQQRRVKTAIAESVATYAIRTATAAPAFTKSAVQTEIAATAQMEATQNSTAGATERHLAFGTLEAQAANFLPDETVSISRNFPLDWPVPPISDKQLAYVRACDVETLANIRYPDGINITNAFEVYEPQSACDWAVLAEAYAQLVERWHQNYGEPEPTVPLAAKYAFAQAVHQNPAFGFATPAIYTTYFDAIPLVQAPPLAEKTITTAVLHYYFATEFGYRITFDVTITQANTDPVVSETIVEHSPFVDFSLYTDPPSGIGDFSWVVSDTIDPEVVQALGQGLTDLVPVPSQVDARVAWLGYDDWQAHLTFEDGTTLDVGTHSSTMLSGGAPMQTRIDGQNYVQYSDAFQRAFSEVFLALGLTKQSVWSLDPKHYHLDLLGILSGELCGTDMSGFECLDE